MFVAPYGVTSLTGQNGEIDNTANYYLDSTEVGFPLQGFTMPTQTQVLTPYAIPTGDTVTIANPTPAPTDPAQIAKGSLSGKYADPFDPLGNKLTGYYWSAGGGTITFNFAAQKSYFGMLWGSVDSFNDISFYNGATLVATFTGTQICSTCNGSQASGGAVFVNIDFNAANNVYFNKVVMSDNSGNSFEFGDVAVNTSVVPISGPYVDVVVPEPAMAGVLAFGLLGLGAARRRRRH